MINLLFKINVFSLPSRVNRVQHCAMIFLYLFLFLGGVVTATYFLEQPKAISNILSTIVAGIYMLFLLVLKVKRLHDINCSGGWILLLFIPVIGWIFGISLFFIRGTQGYNRFGPQSEPAGKLEYAIMLTPIIGLLLLVLYVL